MVTNRIYIQNHENNDFFQIGHSKLKPGTIVKITNPSNMLSFVGKINKRVTYPELYNLLITIPVAKKIELDSKDPFVEIVSLKKNKSFVAKEAKIFQEEKKIHSSAPIEKVKIDNISKKNTIEVSSKISYSILIGEFYSINSVNELKGILAKSLNINEKKFMIKKTKSKVKLMSGTYNSMISLKTDYSKFKEYGFEELNIIRND